MKVFLLLKNIRFYILCFSLFLSLFFYVFYQVRVDPSYTFIHNLIHTYAIIAALYLYLALLIGPFCYNFKTKFNSKIIKGRRAIGVSAFYFATLHLLLSFFGEFGGLPGILASEGKILLAILLAFTAYIILFFMAATSFDFMIKFMTFKRWKLLHRLIYMGAIFILIHALILGEHFQNFNFISIPATILIAFLLYLEGKRVIANVKTEVSKPKEEQ